MPRTVIIGDIHACKHELAALLDHVGFVRGDRLVTVGDMIVRGPYPRGTLDLLQEAGALAVRGNHEDRLLRWRAARRKKQIFSLGPITKATAKRLRKRHWQWLKSLPLWLDLPDHGVRIVHAGLIAGVPIERQDPRTLMYIRCVGRFGESIEQRGKVLWGQVYEGPPHVVFGHNAAAEPQLHPWATGIDTGAVYGGRLTAMVLRDGEAPPPVADRRDALVSVPARRVYFAR